MYFDRLEEKPGCGQQWLIADTFLAGLGKRFAMIQSAALQKASLEILQYGPLGNCCRKVQNRRAGTRLSINCAGCAAISPSDRRQQSPVPRYVGFLLVSHDVGRLKHGIQPNDTARFYLVVVTMTLSRAFMIHLEFGINPHLL